MTPFTSLKTSALVAVTATATTLLIQACGGGAVAQSTTDADAIEGVWESSVTIKDCASNAVLRTFKGVGLFQRGGGLTADNSLPRPTQGIALGNWRRDSGQAHSANFRFLRFNPDGSLAGSQRVQRKLTLSADGTTFSGTLTTQVFDSAEVLLQSACGSETAVRIY